MLKGPEMAELMAAITNAFDADELSMLLYSKLDYDVESRISPGPFQRRVFEIVQDFARQGLDAELIEAIAASRPMRRDVQELYRKYAALLMNDARRGTVDLHAARAIERYGLVREVEVQNGGISVETFRPGLSGADVASLGSPGGLERAISRAEFGDFPRLIGEMVRLEGKVCRVEIEDLARGTGFLVGPDLMLTNYHVIEPLVGRSSGSDLVARFDVKDTPLGPSAGTTVAGSPTADWLVAWGGYTPGEGRGNPDSEEPDSAQLDFALIRLAGPVGAPRAEAGEAEPSPRGWIELPHFAPPIHADMGLLILQHPKTTPPKVALDTRSVIGVSSQGRRVRYRTNTERGASGSPVFDLNMRLVAIHQYGPPAWPEDAPPGVNQGIPIMAIAERLTALGLADLVSLPPL